MSGSWKICASVVLGSNENKSSMMDRDFKPVNDTYLNQAFAGEADRKVLERCRQTAQAYALAENAIVSMGNNIEDCSYCYFGGLADVLGITQEERKPVLPSLYDEFVFSRADADFLAHRHAHELVFIRDMQQLQPKQRNDYFLSDYLRIRDREGMWLWVEHRMFPLASLEDGSFWLCMCVYTICRDEGKKPKIVNTRTGEVRILTNEDYATLLSPRELEVLKLIADGLLSKEIAVRLSISINTVNRHRQNILQKLQVDNAIEACKTGRIMGLLG